MNVGFVSTGTLYRDIATRGLQRQQEEKTSTQTTFDIDNFPIMYYEEGKKAFAEYERYYSSLQSAPQETEGNKVTLSNDDVKALAEKYNTSDMTQSEYNHFLDDLYNMGVISKQDLSTLGHSEYTPAVSLVNLEDMHRGYLANGADLPSIGWQPGFAYGQRHVDVLSMAQYEKSFQYYDTMQNSWKQSSKAAAYGKIYDVLFSMSAQ